MQYRYQCSKCGRHKERIKVVKIDPKTKKKWYILTCPDCDHESDIEEYKAKGPSHNSSQINKYPAPPKGADESYWEEYFGENL